MPDLHITACPHCGRHLPPNLDEGSCPACAQSIPPSPGVLQDRVRRLTGQQQRAGERLERVKREHGDLRLHLERLTNARIEGRRPSAARAEQVGIEARMERLESENVALRARLREAERGLVDAAGMIERLSGLRDELRTLGTRYLQAREEATRLLHEKLELRAELSELADAMQARAARETGAGGTEVERARRTIREALKRERTEPPPP